MLRQRFSLVSALAILLATAFASILMLRPQGDGFGGHKGFPLHWLEWMDTIVDGQVPSRYVWGGLAADILIWVPVILLFGAFVERLVCRAAARRKTKNAA